MRAAAHGPSTASQRPIARSKPDSRPLRPMCQTEHRADRAAATKPAAATAPAAASRRHALLGSSLLAVSTGLLQPAPAHAGLSRYVKKRQLDPLETYVPLVLEARQTLAGLEPVMAADPSVARQQLRSGAFNGMRDNVRALGTYAAQGGLAEADASGLVQGFFRALEDFDLLLYNAVREAKQQAAAAAKQAAVAGGESDGSEQDAAAAVDPAVGLDAAAAGAKLQFALQQLDALIATVPADTRAKAQAVLDKVNGPASAS